MKEIGTAELDFARFLRNMKSKRRFPRIKMQDFVAGFYFETLIMFFIFFLLFKNVFSHTGPPTLEESFKSGLNNNKKK